MNIRKKRLSALMTLGAATAGVVGIRYLTKSVGNMVFDHFLKALTESFYDKNLWEVVSSTMRIGPNVTLETNLRAQQGKLLERPMGPPGKFPSLDDVKFNIAQFHTMPVDVETEIDTSIIIGKYSQKPLALKNPMIIAAMAYGIALSKDVKLALARGASMAGTATNTGAGPFLAEERKEAKYLIYQYNRGDWAKDTEILQNCDAVEIQFGQGAYAGVGHIVKSQLIDRQLRKDLNYPKGKNIVAHSRQPEVQSPEALSGLVEKLRDLSGGVPIGAKIAAGKYLEEDLHWVCNSGVDFVTLDGAEAATKGSPPILQDDFGVPLVFAVNRAARWMEANGFKDRISLIVSGKIRTPGDVLKACALGADACALGAVALMAVSHTQLSKPLPYEPPTTLTWYEGYYSQDFDIQTGARCLNNFLESSRLELAEGIRALGKTSLQQVNRDDLISFNEMIAKGCGIPMAYEPIPYTQ